MVCMRVAGPGRSTSRALRRERARLHHNHTTLSFGFYNQYDSLHPVGNTPVPGSDFVSLVRTDGKSKDGVGALFGVTQVIRTWLSEFNLSVDRFTGYLNDPYKITSIIDSAGNTTGYANSQASGLNTSWPYALPQWQVLARGCCRRWPRTASRSQEPVFARRAPEMPMRGQL